MIHLILGGARSGKSAYAEKLAGSTDQQVIYIATATADDDEMKERINHHKNSRPDNWQLIEEPLLLAHKINQLNSKKYVLLIDCMTLWVTNWLCLEQGKNMELTQGWEFERASFLSALVNSQATILIVSNEVGSGIVPLGELSRQFVDLAGWLNQQLASVANKVTLVVAGLPIELKNDHQQDDKR